MNNCNFAFESQWTASSNKLVVRLRSVRVSLQFFALRAHSVLFSSVSVLLSCICAFFSLVITCVSFCLWAKSLT